ncbi:MAG: COR domain-containing protein [Cyclobacteriaceae bacterium]
MSLEIALEKIKFARENNDTILDLSNLELEKLPSEISELTQLTYLFLNNNQLTEIDALKPLCWLKVISLENNQITIIPDFLIKLNVPIQWKNRIWPIFSELNSAKNIALAINLILDRNQDQALYLIDQALDQVLDLMALDLHGNLELSINLDWARGLVQDLALAQVLVRDQYQYLVPLLYLNRARDRARDLYQNLNPDRYLAPVRDPDRYLAMTIMDQVLGEFLVREQYLNQALMSHSRVRNLAQVRNLALAQARGLLRRARKLEIMDQAQDRALVLFDQVLMSRDQVRPLYLDLTREQDRNQARNQDLYRDRVRDLYRDRARNLDRDLNSIINHAEYYGMYVTANPLEVPPPEVLRHGSDAVKAFMRDFIEKEFLNEVKVILVGEGASGKTSLVKRILSKPFDEKEPQTHGIKIVKHQSKYQKQDLFVNFWDFGGQEIMHATHQFFLTKRCLYVLVLDSRKDERAEYWLNYIQSFGGDAPVIVVMNKNDQNPSFDVYRKFLSKKYSYILDYYKVSCLTNKGVNSLRKDLLNHLWNLELRNTAFPKGWLKVKEHMEAMSEDYIGYSEYQSICKENHVHNEASQKVLLELLNDTGVVLNYEKLRLYDTQVLNPLWLTNAVYRIVNSPILAKSSGRFNIIDLDAIINDERYQKENPEHWANIFKFWKPEQKLTKFPEDKFLFIVAMMKQFELLFQIDEYHYLIPGLLPDEENSYKFDLSDLTLSFIVEYHDFLPTSIIPRLMVKLSKYIHNNQMWKTGMVLEEKLLFHSIANIVLDKESKQINIEIQGKRSRDFLTVIRETIKEINSSYQDLDVTEWIPLPELFKVEQLLRD